VNASRGDLAGVARAATPRRVREEINARRRPGGCAPGSDCHREEVPHTHPTVLLVDDNDDVRDGLTQLMRAEGYAVETARNGREALRVLVTVHPCIILLDLHMPDMSGYDFRQAQVADDGLRDIPVVVYSAAHDVREQAQRISAAAYAEKPIEIARLIQLIRTHCLK
jgi:two-component system, chemotaxis family, chemotaxis protein CheY